MPGRAGQLRPDCYRAGSTRTVKQCAHSAGLGGLPPARVGRAQLLARGVSRHHRPHQEATADLLGGLSASARKLDRLLTNLLDLEQLAWGAIPLLRRPFEIAALLEQVAARWRSDPRWPLVCAPSTTVWLDPDKVERLVEELLANTARHTPPGTPVWIRADRQGTGVRLAVEDAGPGVPSELGAAVFERFRHGDTAPTYAPGLGIGLSLVLGLAELRGGSAWVEDRPGGGASFQVILPGPAR
jgi:two-component system, OmpR family, sensor histidine kinase KdpD